MSKLYNGDCLEIIKSIPDESIDLIVTDPPYGISFRSNYRQIKYREILNDNSLNWLDDFVASVYGKLKNNSHLYTFCSWHNVGLFQLAFARKFDIKNLIVWEKNNTGMGDLEYAFAPKHELCLFCCKGRRKLNGSRDPDIIKVRKTNNKLHPTQKPILLIEYLIRKSSDVGEVVFDPFMGSGSTGVACKRLNRNFIGIELDRQYFEIAKKRIENAEMAITTELW